MEIIVVFVNTLLIGGSEKQSAYLCNALKNDFQVIFIVFHGYLVDDKILQYFDGANFQLIILRGNFVNKAIRLFRLFKRNDVNYLFSYLTKPNFIGAVIGRLAGIKNIYGGIRSTKLPTWKLLIEKFTMNFLTTKTIFNSYLGEKLLGVKESTKTLVIPNCFYNIHDVFVRPIKSHSKIITVGRFDEAKDYKTAIKSIYELTKTKPIFIFQIVGYGKLESEIRKWITYYKLEGFIQVLINPDNIFELLNGADIYLSTSIFEGTSNSIMEAMNASLPIVATNVGDNNRMIFEGENGFLHHVGDYKGIVKSLETLMDDYNLRIKFGIRSNQILRENYSFKKFKESYIQLIEQE